MVKDFIICNKILQIRKNNRRFVESQNGKHKYKNQMDLNYRHPISPCNKKKVCQSGNKVAGDNFSQRKGCLDFIIKTVLSPKENTCTPTKIREIR